MSVCVGVYVFVRDARVVCMQVYPVPNTMNQSPFSGAQSWYSGGSGVTASAKSWSKFAQTLGDNYRGDRCVLPPFCSVFHCILFCPAPLIQLDLALKS